ncbi:MAG: hypothetical protein KJ621_05915 [Proteobacteria bacterium]|nr:hypothetical protein [Pseudomonadota bacterium]MBU1740373.1 hypothetical protein [Pseudomonadota bacterium]
MPYRAFDRIELRCPKLGGAVGFGYCRQVRDGLPCARTLLCFQRLFPVAAYFRRVLEPETFDRVFCTPDPTRLDAFLLAVRQARRSVGPAPVRVSRPESDIDRRTDRREEAGACPPVDGPEPVR